MKLFCFPYAGGSTIGYKDWQRIIGKGIKVRPFEIAGRGSKIVEPFYETIDEAIDKILEEINSEFYSEPYCFFGHSMGANIVINLLKVVIDRRLPLPKHVFLSGSKPPHLYDVDKKEYLLPENEFIDVIKSYGGTPDEFFNDRELLDFFLPMLRSDFKLAESTISDVVKDQIYDIDFTVLYGDSENDLTYDEAYEWSKYTRKNFNIHCIRGTHFFINENPDDVLQIVKNTLSVPVEI